MWKNFDSQFAFNSHFSHRWISFSWVAFQINVETNFSSVIYSNLCCQRHKITDLFIVSHMKSFRRVKSGEQEDHKESSLCWSVVVAPIFSSRIINIFLASQKLHKMRIPLFWKWLTLLLCLHLTNFGEKYKFQLALTFVDFDKAYDSIYPLAL